MLAPEVVPEVEPSPEGEDAAAENAQRETP